jgi:hypothetical protein
VRIAIYDERGRRIRNACLERVLMGAEGNDQVNNL